mmetsp:Transcript_26258/g.61705  ORF Transcript_26258/g.61705 Transcript_26258/m.61705 type:complete len:349 (+) Transcript_26258:109-1155(+)
MPRCYRECCIPVDRKFRLRVCSVINRNDSIQLILQRPVPSIPPHRRVPKCCCCCSGAATARKRNRAREATTAAVGAAPCSSFCSALLRSDPIRSDPNQPRVRARSIRFFESSRLGSPRSPQSHALFFRVLLFDHGLLQGPLRFGHVPALFLTKNLDALLDVVVPSLFLELVSSHRDGRRFEGGLLDLRHGVGDGGEGVHAGLFFGLALPLPLFLLLLALLLVLELHAPLKGGFLASFFPGDGVDVVAFLLFVHGLPVQELVPIELVSKLEVDSLFLLGPLHEFQFEFDLLLDGDVGVGDAVQPLLQLDRKVSLVHLGRRSTSGFGSRTMPGFGTISGFGAILVVVGRR